MKIQYHAHEAMKDNCLGLKYEWKQFKAIFHITFYQSKDAVIGASY